MRAPFEQLARADPRVLGAFRIYFGCVLLFDLACLWPHRGVFFTDAGVLSTAFLAEHPQVPHQMSAFFWCHTEQQAELGFALMALVLIAYTLGAWTRLAQSLALIGVISLHGRNLFLETGAAVAANLLVVWTLFLPLGERYSIDAWRARRRAGAQVDAPPHSFAMPAMLAIRVQCAVIYLLTALHKLTPQWRDGSAIHYVLWQNRTATPLTAWLRMHEPVWFSPLASWATVVIELLIAVLVVWPYAQRRTRLLALGLAIALHGAIAALIHLGTFSWVMIAFVLVTVRPRAGATDPADAAHAAPRRTHGVGAALQNVALALLALMLVSSLLVDDPWLRRLGVQPSRWLLTPASALRLRQRWTMYSSVPEHDGMLVVDAVTQSGRHVDPFTGRAPDWDAPLRAPVAHAEPITSYLVGIATPIGSAYLSELLRYLHGLRTSNETIRSFQIWWVGHRAPPPGATQACCPTRTLIHPRNGS